MKFKYFPTKHTWRTIRERIDCTFRDPSCRGERFQVLADRLHEHRSLHAAIVPFMKKIIIAFFSPGFGSVSIEQIDSSTFEMVNAGDHCDRRISRQIEPLLLMLGW